MYKVYLCCYSCFMENDIQDADFENDLMDAVTDIRDDVTAIRRVLESVLRMLLEKPRESVGPSIG